MRDGLPYVWGATVDELRATYPSERFVAPDAARVIRAVDTTAPGPSLWAWLCQIRRAPYSYDLLDNRGRRSPRQLDPSLLELEVGQTFSGAFTLVDFVDGESITLMTRPGMPTRMFGPLAMTYTWHPTGAGANRLVGVIDLPPHGRIVPGVRRWLLAWGDLPMMRKQLTTLAHLAES